MPELQIWHIVSKVDVNLALLNDHEGVSEDKRAEVYVFLHLAHDVFNLQSDHHYVL